MKYYIFFYFYFNLITKKYISCHFLFIYFKYLKILFLIKNYKIYKNHSFKIYNNLIVLGLNF